MKQRCDWVTEDPLYIKYHDLEWGVPVHDDQTLFEFLILEGAQAGLSWITILRKRTYYREAFDYFDPDIVAEYGDDKIEALCHNEGIIRNRLKINSAVTNAQAFLKIQEQFGSFDHFLWSYVDYSPIHNHWESIREVPAKTELSTLLSKDLKKRGLKFVGPTICYSFMQAVGLINDHTIDCYRYGELNKPY
ncbi:MAG TPA: DNA-3-methyladenine glycosylase I [Balneolales bacterium]|nr:DNA-3-methyladenine glycosylase I [Balneolales bacterium]